MKAVLPLRLALAANAVFSLSSALFMLFWPALLGEWLGIHASLIFQVAGIGLVVFAVELIYQATRRRVATWRALLASAADFSWVAGSVVLLLAFPRLFSPSGSVLVLAVAGAVFVFGVWQLWAAGRAHRTAESGEYRHCIIVETNAPADTMWRVISRLGEIKNYMPSLKSSVVLDGRMPGVGAVRMCEDYTGKRWSEQCTEFNAGRGFAVRFLSEVPDFPFPAETMRGGWEVIPADDGCQVMVWWELLPKPRVLAPIILPLLAFQVDRDFPKVIKRMAAEALGRTLETADQASPGAIARLAPNFC